MKKNISKMEKKKKAFVYGYYSGNFGDDLFLSILLDRYPDTKFYIIANKLKYQDLNNRKNLHIYDSNNKIINYFYKRYLTTGKNVLDRKRYIRLILGGSMFIEGQMDVEALKKRYANKDYYILGANVSSHISEQYKTALIQLFNRSCDICVRDWKTYSLFSESVNHIRMASDIAFNTEIKANLGKKQIAISIINAENRNFAKEQIQQYNHLIYDIIEQSLKKGYEVVLLALCEKQGDCETAGQYKNKFPNIKIITYNGDIDMVIQTINDSEIIVATRFHAMILGLLMQKIVVPIAYDDKMNHVLADMHFSNIWFDFKDNLIFRDFFNQEYCKVDTTMAVKDAKKHFMLLDHELGES